MSNPSQWPSESGAVKKWSTEHGIIVRGESPFLLGAGAGYN